MKIKILLFLLPVSSVFAYDILLSENLKERSERVVLDESIAAEQARTEAQSRSEYGLELRPKVTDDSVSLALRVYLPSRWNKSKLREQLALVAESEQLRVSALEWQELMDVYRLFCDYRMLGKQLKIFDSERELLEPYLEKANEGVELNQLLVTDRAKLYSLYLDMVNSHENVKLDLLKVEQSLRLLLGVHADLERMAEAAVVQMPPKQEFNSMLKQALENRPDYRKFNVQARKLDADEAVARSEDGFRLKYLQPEYAANYNNGESTYGISASFVLPWGTRNPDIARFQQERLLADSSMELQRMIISHRLQVILTSAENYYAQASVRRAHLVPLLDQLKQDLKMMNTGRLEDLRDLMLVRERILDVSLRTAEAVGHKERLAVDLAEELGTLAQ